MPRRGDPARGARASRGRGEVPRRPGRRSSRSTSTYLAAAEHDDSTTPVQEHRRARGARRGAALRRVPARRSSRATRRCSSTRARGATATAATSRARYVRGTSAAAQRFGDAARADGSAVQQRGDLRVKPGMPYEDLHDECHRLLADVLLETGLGKGSASELVDRGITRALLPARPRPLARGHRPRCRDEAAAAPRREPVPAEYVDDRGRSGVHHRARAATSSMACSDRCAKILGATSSTGRRSTSCARSAGSGSRTTSSCAMVASAI